MNQKNFQNLDEPMAFGEVIAELLKVMVIALVIIIPIRYFVLQPFFVKGASMEPNFFDNQYLLIDEISYRFKEPQRGEIVVFRPPTDPRQFYIKRIIGLPGDNVEIKDNNILINGIKVDESGYLAKDTVTVGNSYTKLGPEEYFLLGDNREQSLDSRVFGAVKRKFIVGRAWIRGWPFTQVTVFETPNYNF